MKQHRFFYINKGESKMDTDMKKIVEETVKEMVEKTNKTQTEPKKKKKMNGLAMYLLGSAVVTASMAAVMPKVMNKMGQKIYSASLKKQHTDDEWKQEFLKQMQNKTKTKEEKNE